MASLHPPHRIPHQTHQLDQFCRELKCPICLSLFKQAASLSCNHTFCNACILQSIKMNSACPVCKVHTTRRDVRAAPQMDSLVAIYMSMESSAGIEPLSSQFSAPNVPPADAVLPSKHVRKRGKPLSNITNNGKRLCNKPPRLRDSSKSPEKLLKSAKKRVQVPRFSSLSGELGLHEDEAQLPFKSQTSAKSMHSECNDVENTSDDRDATIRKDVSSATSAQIFTQFPGNKQSRQLDNVESGKVDELAADDIKRPKLDPFFWLRDENSQDIDGDDDIQLTHLTQTQPILQPDFSDLKDNDDHSTDEQEKEVTNGMYAGAAGHGSCVFEWTQLPCSPELKCSPVKAQENSSRMSPVKSVEGLASNSEKASKQVFKAESSIKESKEKKKCGRSQICPKAKKATNMVDARMVNCCQKQDLVSTSHAAASLPSVTMSIKANVLNDAAKKTLNTRLISSKRMPLDSSKPPKRKDISTTQGVDRPGKKAIRMLPKSWKSRDMPESSEIVCAFCQTSGDSPVAGCMMHYKNGVPTDESAQGKLVHVHRLCAEWAPDVYFEENVAKNLPAEIGRGLKIKCRDCGRRGAALGCCLKRCRRSYHYPCARTLSCKWDNDNFVVLCPEHQDENFPVAHRTVSRVSKACQDSGSGNAQNISTNTKTGENNSDKWSSGTASKWVLSGSGLNSSGKEQLAAFASLTGATVTNTWNSNVTHLISGTDEHGAARRTVKFLRAILDGKWILNSDWMAACTLAGQPVKEEMFEISMDIHGVAGGPKRGRLLTAKRGPRLFETWRFFFMGDFEPSYKADLQALVVAAGGGVLHRKPVVSEDNAGRQRTIVVYNSDWHSGIVQVRMTDTRQVEATVLGKSVGAQVVPHSWILDCIASCKLLNVN